MIGRLAGFVIVVLVVINAFLAVGISVLATQEAPTPLPPFPTATPSASALPSFPTATPSPLPPTRSSGPIVETACYAEPKWSHTIDVRREPNVASDLLRQFEHAFETVEMRVIGQDTSGEWLQAVMPHPNDDQLGWIRLSEQNVYGNCSDLPIYSELLATVPSKLPNRELPDFALESVTLSPYDRAFWVNDAMLYVRRTVPGDEEDRQQIHLLMMDLADPRLSIGTVIGAKAGVSGTPVSEMARSAGALAAITGDYFGGNYFPQNITVIDGEVVTAPKFRSAFGVTHDDEPFIGYFTRDWTWNSYITAENGEILPLQLMNLPCDLRWLCAYTHHRGQPLDAEYGGIRVILDEDHVVQEILGEETVIIESGQLVLRAGEETGDWLLDNLRVGDRVGVNMITDPPWQDFQTVVGGGPRILVDGEFRRDCDPAEAEPICEEFTQEFRDRHYGFNTLPRTAIGYKDQVVYAVVVEGYEVQDSNGLNQWQLAQFFIEFGAEQAMEFDGGGSATMFIQPGGAISDHGEDGERKVSNAVLFYWDESD